MDLLASSSSGASASKPRKPTDVSNEHEEPWPDSIVEYLLSALDPSRESFDGGDDPFDDPDPVDEDIMDDPLPASIRPRGRRNSDPHLTVGKTCLSFIAASKVPDACPTTRHISCLGSLPYFEHSQRFKDRLKERTSEKMNLKLQNNSFVSHVKICDLSLGDNPPKIQSIRLIKGVTEDLNVTLELDLTYNGGSSIAIETTLTRGMTMAARVYMSAFAGKIRIRTPSVDWPDMLSVAFVEDPG
ncbi:hypothetical protein BC829DRAFT_431510 [Chytridium lagenaria]|nr:hypothetical protein BC829DRAFT_431510 [Chytridium lagenaria]